MASGVMSALCQKADSCTAQQPKLAQGRYSLIFANSRRGLNPKFSETVSLALVPLHPRGTRLYSRFLRALFQFSKRAAGESTKFGRSGVKLLGVVGAARLECGEPAAESGELIRRQLGNNFGDFLDFHGAQYSTGWACFSDGSDLPGLQSTARLAHQIQPDGKAGAARPPSPMIRSRSDVLVNALATSSRAETLRISQLCSFRATP
jgi:hypothetical protein